MRIRLDLAYDGAGFSGWAKQPGRRTVQGDLEAALEQVLRVSEARVVVAGRTDTGVHALGQVCHVDVEQWPDQTQRRLNAVLADDVRIRAAGPAPDGFDARFSALSRQYVYLISDSGLLDPRARGGVWVWRRGLDSESMHDAAQRLIGEHDFAAFCKAPARGQLRTDRAGTRSRASQRPARPPPDRDRHPGRRVLPLDGAFHRGRATGSG
ncbi:MAG: tRNA pseudouridine synthase A [Candidatus Nanopelagicales bacterium]